MNTAPFNAIVVANAPTWKVDAENLLAPLRTAVSSPIDEFLDNARSITLHWAPGVATGANVAPELSRLLLLGYVSAVESYLRALISRIVHIDPYASAKSGTQNLSYHAAMHHEPRNMADALLEASSFTSKENINKAIKEFLGIQLDGQTAVVFDPYEELCELRHCCTHRFGKIGVKQAAKLAAGNLSPYLNRQIALDNKSLSATADVVHSLVQTLNNQIWIKVMRRTVTDEPPGSTEKGLGWTWWMNRDRQLFKKYYDVFASTGTAAPSPAMDDMYRAFRNEFRTYNRPKRATS